MMNQKKDLITNPLTYKNGMNYVMLDERPKSYSTKKKEKYDFKYLASLKADKYIPIEVNNVAIFKTEYISDKKYGNLNDSKVNILDIVLNNIEFFDGGTF